MPKPEVIFEIEDGAERTAETARNLLRERYGVFQIATTAVNEANSDAATQLEAEVPRIQVSENRVDFPGSGEEDHLGHTMSIALSRFVLRHLRLQPDQQSIRMDRHVLESYRHSSGGIDVMRDPRQWINRNALVCQLQEVHPQYHQLVDYVSEEMGLFIKPAAYKNERNYWNAPTNGGLPIVRKKDEIHEGTFMLHDLFHFSIQDPLPVSTGRNPDALAIYLRHRMASEATTLVLTDMLAVDAAGLKAQGYDVGKRKIYPLFESVKENLKGEDPQTVRQLLIEANIEFALTGRSDRFRQLGADPASLREYEAKYEVFFSADYDWNKSNWHQVAAEQSSNPHLDEYVEEVRHSFGVPVVEDLYPEQGTVQEIIPSFVDQVSRALSYQRHPNGDLQRMKQSSLKYLGGQLVAFYRFAEVADAREARKTFLQACQQIQKASNVEEVQQNFNLASTVYAAHIRACASRGMIGAQETSLYLLHAPLYPPLFINYAQQANDFRNLAEKMRADNIY